MRYLLALLAAGLSVTAFVAGETGTQAEETAPAVQAVADSGPRVESCLSPADLREAVAEHQRDHYGLHLDPDSQIAVSAGATEGTPAAPGADPQLHVAEDQRDHASPPSVKRSFFMPATSIGRCVAAMTMPPSSM